jgi:signal transduction histidine kinase
LALQTKVAEGRRVTQGDGDSHSFRSVGDQKKVHRALEQTERELILLNQACQVLASTLDLDQVLNVLLKEMRDVLGVETCSVWLVNPEMDDLICRQAIDPQGDVLRRGCMPLGRGLADWVAHHGQSLITPDARIDERYNEATERQTGLGMRSVLTVPMSFERSVIGVLQVSDMEVGRFVATDLRLMESLATLAAVSIGNARLVGALHQRTIELERRNEDLDAFAHTVAHELKTLLSLIVGPAETLAEVYTAISDEELLHYLHMMARSGRKMSDIIDALLLLAQIRREEVETTPLHMAGIVAEAIRRVADMAKERRAEIVVPESWPMALGYAPWVEEVWVNYLSNAIKYSGILPRVELGAESNDGVVRFWVRDNGPGLTPEARAQLFKLSPQIDRTDGNGHGLGLSIVRRIVEKLDGQVSADSEVGRGSVFAFVLPRADARRSLKFGRKRQNLVSSPV